jgi:hypothetical protein
MEMIENIKNIIFSGEVELGLQLTKSLRPRVSQKKFIEEHFGDLLILICESFSKKSLIHLVQRDYMWLNDRNLTEISNNIGQLKNLKWLNLSCNNLTTIPESIVQLTNLKGLNLSYNQLSKETKEMLIKQLPDCRIQF